MKLKIKYYNEQYDYNGEATIELGPHQGVFGIKVKVVRDYGDGDIETQSLILDLDDDLYVDQRIERVVNFLDNELDKEELDKIYNYLENYEE